MGFLHKFQDRQTKYQWAVNENHEMEWEYSITELKLDETNYASAIPAYLCIIAMPLFYSISEGIAVNVIINLFCGM